jgi:hypothetical protein|tara:strand:- start:25 stop:609 length:585 start_codon:yes stop_codon:yes gene_type:complete
MKKLYENLINQLIEIGRSETIPDNPKYSVLNDGWWQRRRYPTSEDVDSYSYEEFKSLFKGVVLCEKEFEWQVGSATNTDWIFRNLKNRPEYIEDYQERKELYEFGFANKGDYPYVSENSGLRSTYESYEDYLKASAEAKIEKDKRSAQLFEIQKASKELSAVKKEFKERDKEERMKERAERKKEKDKNISIIEF